MTRPDEPHGTPTPRPIRYATAAWLQIGVPDTCTPIRVQLFHDAVGRVSPEYGPYVFVQTSYGVLRGICVQHPRAEEVIAELDPDTGRWRAQDRQDYTDVVCWATPQTP